MDRLEVEKMGEVWFSFSTFRKMNMTEVECKAHPAIEAYFQAVSGGNAMPVSKYGFGRWESAIPGDTICAYSLPDNACVDNDEAFLYPGHRLLINHGEDNTQFIANLSFLRIAGISKGIGVKFLLDYPISTKLQNTLDTLVHKGVSRFCREYLVPSKVGLVLIDPSVVSSFGTGERP